MNCGACTVCCTLSVVEELEKGAGVTCEHCGQGCNIYDSRPQTCKEFECAYLQAGRDIELRPDNCGIMFFKRKDHIFTGVLVPDAEVSNKAKGQVEAFNNQGISVILLKIGEKKPMIMLAKGHNEKEIYLEYLQELQRLAGHGNV